MMRRALCVGNVFIVDENLWYSKLWDGRHAALLLLFHRASETARPVEGIEEADDDIATHSLFDTLKTSASAEELFKPIPVSAQ